VGAERETTVLCIEDNPSSLRLMERVFALRPAIRLVTASDGRAGLELARQHEPAMVLLDIHLPDLSGHEVLSELRVGSTTSDATLIVTSADATQAQIDKALAGGATEYLTKPVEIKALLATIDAYLATEETDVT
jgi:CheY-like chemotaxis protein